MKRMNVPNSLTLFRIVLIPILVGVFYLPFGWRYPVSATVFALAAITDWFDGFLARKLGQTSLFGEFLDPVADKLIVAVALVLLVGAHSTPLFAIPAAVIVCREIAISALREWMAELGKRANVKVSYLGKVKTAVQMAAILCLLAAKKDFSSWITLLGYIGIYMAALLTLWSMIIYLKAAWSDFKE